MEKVKVFVKRYEDLRRDMISEILDIVKAEPKLVSIRAEDPYDYESSIGIYEITDRGVLTEEYIGAIPFDILSVETLLCIYRELEASNGKSYTKSS